MGIAFMLLGIIIKPIIDLLIKFKNIKLILISIMTFLGTLCFMFNDIKYVLMAENNYGNLLIFLPTAICGCLLILCLSILIDHLANKQLKNLLVFLGKNTLVIFACHKQFISLMNSIFSKLSFNIPNLVSITITTTLSIIFCSIIIILINQYIPSLNGKSNSK
jgi:fucose 4-O-acetylase-like acetyltransferase